jgi:peptidoglycan/xylan/chitin deacetylase (PgdA/CDA1 family)
VHAYTHVDLTTLSYEEQARNIELAVHTFRGHGIPFTGFRAPYLHWNEETMRVVETYQFLYSSNQAVFWDVLDVEALSPREKEGLDRGLEFYKPWRAEEVVVLPFKKRGFVEIPVSLPDDEILLDRMYIHDAEALGKVWARILDRSHERGELFTLQLHPERIDFFASALGGLLADCRNRRAGVWIATLGEIADWWNRKHDNSATLVDMGDKVRVTVKVCEGTTVFIRENGSERRVEPGEIDMPGGKRTCVGVSPGSDRRAVQLLRDKGYIIEVGADPDDYVIHLGKLGDGDVLDSLAELDGFPGPLVRFGTWPHGNRSALAVTGDIDAVTIWDFLNRLRGA